MILLGKMLLAFAFNPSELRLLCAERKPWQMLCNDGSGIAFFRMQGSLTQAERPITCISAFAPRSRSRAVVTFGQCNAVTLRDRGSFDIAVEIALPCPHPMSGVPNGRRDWREVVMLQAEEGADVLNMSPCWDGWRHENAVDKQPMRSQKREYSTRKLRPRQLTRRSEDRLEASNNGPEDEQAASPTPVHGRAESVSISSPTGGKPVREVAWRGSD
ncbi:hypothetical protein BCR34DRAFT_589455 [Clohesyomyces aquaticus]|uniref:Uncharacterized protein n=1 Tax=Clohesyomyces aquaticus TaxID=1231657 RepID=A0A1Y1ZG14_9PLEO|nr:hypothetical protein BCR34DRAFT_589455 [Clohesyomyces aquaticus]